VKPEYLPDAHKLWERGWLDILTTKDHLLFALSQTGITSLELGCAREDYVGAVN
jgi:hypothetical protein